MAKKGSLVHQVARKCSGLKLGGSGPSKNSIVQYQHHAIQFARWCQKHEGCNSVEDITADAVRLLNLYSRWLQEEGKTAATIHTYIAGCCAVWQIPMEQVDKPLRHCYENTRSRGEKGVDRRKDAGREASPRAYDFAQAVGLRRSECFRLRGDNFKEDESGYPCVEVLKGKGGKYQLQRLLPEDVAFIEKFFDGSQNYIFTKEEKKNKIDIHHLRALLAQRAYRYYTDRLSSEPGYRAQLEEEIEARWRRFRTAPAKGRGKDRDRAWDVGKVRGFYHLRGENRRVAAEKRLPVSYDRCAVMAVSVFHLSHWRCDVTVDNYLLAG